MSSSPVSPVSRSNSTTPLNQARPPKKWVEPSKEQKVFTQTIPADASSQSPSPARKINAKQNAAPSKAKAALAALSKNIKSKQPDYAGAYETSKFTFNHIDELTKNEASQLMSMFAKLQKTDKDTIGQDFYAWLLCVLTWDLEQKDADSPVKHTEKILADYEQSADLGCYTARHNLAIFLGELGRNQESFDQWIKCTEQFPDEGKAFNELGVFYESDWEGHPANYEKAKEYYEHGVRLEYIDSALNLARLLETKAVETPKERSRVIELYTMVKEQKIPFGIYNLGVILQKGWAGTSVEHRKRYDNSLVDLNQAEELFRECLALDPTDMDYPAAIGETILLNKDRLTQERHSEAMGHYAVAILGGSTEAAYLRAITCRDGNKWLEGDKDLAMQDLKQLEQQEEDRPIQLEALLRLAELYFDTEDADSCIDMLLKADTICTEIPELSISENGFDRKAYIQTLLNKAREARMNLSE